MGPQSPVTGILIRRRNEDGDFVKAEAESTAMGPPEAGRGRKDPLPAGFREGMTLLTPYWPSGL